MRLKNVMDNTQARVGKALAFFVIVIGVVWLLLIIALVKHTKKSTSLIVLNAVSGIWNCVTGTLGTAITKERAENANCFRRVLIVFAFVSALLGALKTGVYGASLDDDQIFSLRPHEDGDGPAVVVIVFSAMIVGSLQCLTGISAAILCCTMNPDHCSLCRINNQQVQHITHSSNYTTTERPTEVFGGGSMLEGDEMVTAQVSRDQKAEPVRVLVPLYEEREGERQFFRGPSFEATFSTGNQCQLPARPPIITYV